MPELSQNHYIEVNGYQIRYIEEGSGKPIIFQSGLGFDASCDQFIPTMKLLASIKQKTIIIKVITSSVFGTFMALGCWMMGQAYIEKLPLASILGQTALIFILIFSWIFLKEKITKIRIIASLFALLGVFLSNYF